MKVLTLMPTRGSSKTISCRNVRDLCCEPLIAHTIAVTRGAASIDRFAVRAEDEKIAGVGSAWGGCL